MRRSAQREAVAAGPTSVRSCPSGGRASGPRARARATLLGGRVHAGTTGPDPFKAFGVGLDGQVNEREWDGMQCLPAVSLGGNFVVDLAVASSRGRTLSLLAVGVDGKVQHSVFENPAWSSRQRMDGNMRASQLGGGLISAVP